MGASPAVAAASTSAPDTNAVVVRRRTNVKHSKAEPGAAGTRVVRPPREKLPKLKPTIELVEVDDDEEKEERPEDLIVTGTVDCVRACAASLD